MAILQCMQIENNHKCSQRITDERTLWRFFSLLISWLCKPIKVTITNQAIEKHWTALNYTKTKKNKKRKHGIELINRMKTRRFLVVMLICLNLITYDLLICLFLLTAGYN